MGSEGKNGERQRVGRRQGRTKGKKGKQGAQVAERIEDGEAK